MPEKVCANAPRFCMRWRSLSVNLFLLIGYTTSRQNVTTNCKMYFRFWAFTQENIVDSFLRCLIICWWFQMLMIWGFFGLRGNVGMCCYVRIQGWCDVIFALLVHWPYMLCLRNCHAAVCNCAQHYWANGLFDHFNFYHLNELLLNNFICGLKLFDNKHKSACYLVACASHKTWHSAAC